ncbi:MAG: Htur_1727 family rSAM-partnered candidate RiPP [Halobacteriota archaeon]
MTGDDHGMTPQTDPRATHTRQWEVFVREASADPVRHVGSVSAPTETIAHEEARGLFDRYAAAIWLCPADETRRFSEYSLAGDTAKEGPQ